MPSLASGNHASTGKRRSVRIACCRRGADGRLGDRCVQHNATRARHGRREPGQHATGNRGGPRRGQCGSRTRCSRPGISVEISEPSVGAARERAARVTDAVIDGLERHGVEERDMQTGRFSIHPEYQYRGRPAPSDRLPGCPRTDGHVPESGHRGPAIDAVSEAGGDELAFRDIVFTHAEPERALFRPPCRGAGTLGTPARRAGPPACRHAAGSSGWRARSSCRIRSAKPWM